tara:strand:+ start:648 stop:908 length:261 start_codon:yes stop_codon:yes gene_type:complete
MKIFFIFSIIIIAILLIGRDIIYSAKRNLFKDQAAWSGKDIKIKHKATKGYSESKENENYLKMIADESKSYLENESKKKEYHDKEF